MICSRHVLLRHLPRVKSLLIFLQLVLIGSTPSLGQQEPHSWKWENSPVDESWFLQVKENRYLTLEQPGANYITIGYYNSDNCFNPIWRNAIHYGGQTSDLGGETYLFSAAQMHENGNSTFSLTQDSCIVFTFSSDYQHTDTSYVVKVDTGGRLVWVRKLANSSTQTLTYAIESPSGDIGFCVNNTFDRDPTTGISQIENLFYILAPDGTTKVRKRIVMDQPNPVYGIAATPDSGFVLVSGGYGPLHSQNVTQFVLKVDSLGNPVWQQRIKMPEKINRIRVSEEANIFITVQGVWDDPLFNTKSGIIKLRHDGSFGFYKKIDSISGSYAYPDDIFVHDSLVYIVISKAGRTLWNGSFGYIVLNSSGNILGKHATVNLLPLSFATPFASNAFGITCDAGLEAWNSQLPKYTDIPCYFNGTFSGNFTNHSLIIEDTIGDTEFSTAPALEQGFLSVLPVPVAHKVTPICQTNRFLPRDTSFCLGSSVTARTYIPGATYRWSNGETTAAIEPQQSGQYWVEVTTPTQCVMTDTINILIEDNGLGDFLPADTALCFGNSLNFSFNHSEVSYRWSTGDTTSSITLTKSGNYWLEVTPDSGCTSTEYMKAEFLQKMLVDLGEDTIKCPNEPLTLKAGVPNLNFMWFLPSDDTAYGQQVQVYDSGQYRVRVADAGGCVDLDTLNLAHHALPQTQAGPDTAICFGQMVTLSGKGGITYTWQPPDHLDNPLVANPKASPPDSIRYWLITVNAQGCRDTDDVFIAVRPPLHAVVPQQVSACAGDSLTVEATGAQGGSGPYTFTWLDEQGQVLQTGAVATFAANDISWAFIQLRLEDGCTTPFVDTIPITIHPAADAAFTATPTAGCEPHTVQFQYTGSSGWQSVTFTTGGGQTLSELPTQRTYLQPGTYTSRLTITGQGGCTDSRSATITVHPRPEAAFTAEPERTRITQPQITFRNESNPASRYTWHFGDGHSATTTHTKHRYSDTGTFTVLLLAHNDLCTDTATGTIRISDRVRVFLPSAFSPNADPHNNLFAPQTTAVEQYTLTIYNRWGELIWQGHRGWNGHSHPGGGNSPAPEGVYVYKLEYISDFGETQYLHGSVTLVR